VIDLDKKLIAMVIAPNRLDRSLRLSNALG